jgi:hypothetical protein
MTAEGSTPWAVELRYATTAKLRDVLGAVLTAVMPGSLLLVPLGHWLGGLSLVHALGVWAGVAVGVLVCLAPRWSARGRLDGRGLAVQAGAFGPSTEIAWEGVEEVFFLPRGGFEVRGDGRRLVVPWTMEGASGARAWVVDRSTPAVERRLRASLDRDGVAVLPGLWSRPAGWSALAALALVLSTPTALLLGVPEQALGCAVILLPVLGAIGLAAAYKLAWMFACLEVRPEGLRLVRYRRERLYTWAEIRGLERRPDGEVVVVFGWREALVLPPSVANLWVLPAVHARFRKPPGTGPSCPGGVVVEPP